MPGAEFDPRQRAFDMEELRPQPIIRLERPFLRARTSFVKTRQFYLQYLVIVTRYPMLCHFAGFYSVYTVPSVSKVPSLFVFCIEISSFFYSSD